MIGAMNKEELQLIRERLQGLLDGLTVEVNSTVNGMRQDGTPFPDPTDRATLESDRNLTLRIRDRERKLQTKVEEALARLDDGTYGICELCEEQIGFKRLEARPVTTLCIDCKELQEHNEEKHSA